MCQQQSGDPEHMMELETLLADWLGEGSIEVQGSTETQGSTEAQGLTEAQKGSVV